MRGFSRLKDLFRLEIRGSDAETGVLPAVYLIDQLPKGYSVHPRLRSNQIPKNAPMLKVHTVCDVSDSPVPEVSLTPKINFY